MTGLSFLENINSVDDDLIAEAESWVRSKVRSPRILVGIMTGAACLCLAIGLAVNYSKERNDPMGEDRLSGCLMLPGSDEIYPTVMVNGTLYEWLFGKAIIDELPVGSVYYGNINHTNGTTPENDREFVSVFSASGRIFVDPNEDLVYLELTTDWLEGQIVIFEPISASKRYQYQMGVMPPE